MSTKTKEALRETTGEFLKVIVGCFLMGLAIQCIYGPNNMVIGGLSGLAIVIQHVIGKWIPVENALGLISMVLNIPAFVIAFFTRGWRFIAKAFFAMIMLSAWMTVLPVSLINTNDMVLSTAFGALLMGVGMGLVFSAGTMTGGTELIAMLLRGLLPHYSTIQIMMVLDWLIVLLGVFVFGVEASLYAIIAIFIAGHVSDRILEGAKFGKMVFVISDSAEAIAQRIMTELERGVTGLDVTGMYSGEKRKMLFCIVSKKELYVFRKIVHEEDHRAFMIVSDVREALGEGFFSMEKQHTSEF